MPIHLNLADSDQEGGVGEDLEADWCSRAKNPVSRDEQLRRNREAAKHSRQRRKEYVRSLEIKNQSNQKIIDELEHKLKEV
jgi:hypothetical protein